jgi:hypothetical protein
VFVVGDQAVAADGDDDPLAWHGELTWSGP